MDLQKLRYFWVLAQELHFGRAATRLYLSQSALSTAIRSLERGLGVELFRRTSRSVELTAAGRELLPLAQQVLADADHLLESVREHRDAGPTTRRLRLAFVGQAANELTPRLVEAFQQRHPHLLVQPRQVTTTGVAQALQQQEAEVAVLRLPLSATAGLTVRPLFAEDRVAVVPSDHWAAGRAGVALSELLSEPWVVGACEDDAQWRFSTAQDHRGGRPLRTGQSVTTLDEYLEAIAAHRGIGLAPVSAARYYARPGIAFVPVPDADLSVVALAWVATAHRAAQWGESLYALAQELLELVPVPGSRPVAAQVVDQPA